jgi:colanic acid/amylovoran biosynthesis glycosyltransferase
MSLTLVGKDPEGLRPHLLQIVSDHGLLGQVEVIDGIDFSRLHAFLNQFHVFIHPSKYGKLRDSEGGAPVVLLDAQATGMPVLSTFHCDIPGVVVNGMTGILVQEDDVVELANAIELFYKMDESDYGSFCERARRHVEENYDAVKCSQRLRDEYQLLIDNIKTKGA